MDCHDYLRRRGPLLIAQYKSVTEILNFEDGAEDNLFTENYTGYRHLDNAESDTVQNSISWLSRSSL